jgi:hypothetical protein
VRQRYSSATPHARNSLLARAQQARVPSGWSDTISDGQGGQVDRLTNLGQAQNYNINVDHGTTVHCSLWVESIVQRTLGIADRPRARASVVHGRSTLDDNAPQHHVP